MACDECINRAAPIDCDCPEELWDGTTSGVEPDSIYYFDDHHDVPESEKPITE